MKKFLLALIALALVLCLCCGAAAMASEAPADEVSAPAADGSDGLTGWVNGGTEDSPRWFYYGSDGNPVTGWQKIGGYWYLFVSSDMYNYEYYTEDYYSGEMLCLEWYEDASGNRYYFPESGRMVTGWQEIPADSGRWYYFTSGGKQVTGWQKSGSSWYYLDPDNYGIMTANTGLEIDGVTYYFDADGHMATGWKEIPADSGRWYYFASNGKQVTGWLKSGGYWYYLDPDQDGAMLRGCWYSDPEDVSAPTYSFDDDGRMVTGWEQVGDSYYYYKSNGEQARGEWLQSGSNWYYLKADGVMACSETLTIDGVEYEFGPTGKWMPISLNAALQAYADKLSTLAGYSSRFALIYVDNDDVPELVISTGNMHAGTGTVYAFDGTKLNEKTSGDYGNTYYKPRTGYMINDVWINGYGESITNYYLSNGTWSKVSSAGSGSTTTITYYNMFSITTANISSMLSDYTAFVM